MAGNIFQWSSRHIVGGQVLHGISAGVISGAGWSEHMGVLLGTGRCDIAKTPTLSKRFTVVSVVGHSLEYAVNRKKATHFSPFNL
jgi:hypothetical protein